MNYNFETKHIKEISNFNFLNGNYHYIFKNCHFLYKNGNKNNLIIFFHGALNKSNISLYTFRGYNYDFEKADVLCISDKLITIFYPNLYLSWFLSTKKYDNFNIYIEIIQKIINKYNKIIFTGSSGGGFPALLFSSFFNGICLIMNSQIYLNKYKYWENMINNINDDVYYVDIEKYINEFRCPKKIIMYNNIMDEHHYKIHALPFKKFMEENYKNILQTEFFKDESKKDFHGILFPQNTSYYKVLNSLLNS